ncbi:MAG: DUF2007 domain-containing protein [Bacteroidales bacterium]
MSKEDMEKLVTLAQFHENAEAGLVKSYLESRGIECVINDSISNQLFGGYIDMSGIQLDVLEKELPHARKAMEEGGFEEYLV